MFTLPKTFTPKSYADVGAALTGCFEAAQWNVPMKVTDASCPAPATPASSNFCPLPTPTPTPM
jgi:hypothetical protein